MPTIEEIEKSWSVDSIIDETKLLTYSMEVPKHHNKYYTMLLKELYRLQMLEDELKKTQHYLELLYQSNRLTNEEYDMLNWEPLAKIPPTATERSRCIDIDPRMVDIRMRHLQQKLKCEYLREIVDKLNRMSYSIRNMIDIKKFEAGM